MKILALSLLAALILHGCASDDSRDPQMADDHIATDPVSYAEVRSDSDWNTYWKGHWYYFEPRENQRKFEADPTSYVDGDGRLRQERPQERYKVYPHQLQ